MGVNILTSTSLISVYRYSLSFNLSLFNCLGQICVSGRLYLKRIDAPGDMIVWHVVGNLRWLQRLVKLWIGLSMLPIATPPAVALVCSNSTNWVWNSHVFLLGNMVDWINSPLDSIIGKTSLDGIFDLCVAFCDFPQYYGIFWSNMVDLISCSFVGPRSINIIGVAFIALMKITRFLSPLSAVVVFFCQVISIYHIH